MANMPILPDAFNIAHEPENVLLIWWYNLYNGQFEYSESENHIAIVKNKNLPVDRSWIKGRLVSYRGSIYLVAYTREYLHNPVDADNLNDLAGKVRKACKDIRVDYFIDEKGYDMLEAVKHNDRIVLEKLLVGVGGK